MHYTQVYYLVGSLLSRAAKERFITQTRIAYQASAAVFKKLAHKYFVNLFIFPLLNTIILYTILKTIWFDIFYSNEDF